MMTLNVAANRTCHMEVCCENILYSPDVAYNELGGVSVGILLRWNGDLHS